MTNALTKMKHPQAGEILPFTKLSKVMIIRLMIKSQHSHWKSIFLKMYT